MFRLAFTTVGVLNRSRIFSTFSNPTIHTPLLPPKHLHRHCFRSSCAAGKRGWGGGGKQGVLWDFRLSGKGIEVLLYELLFLPVVTSYGVSFASLHTRVSMRSRKTSHSLQNQPLLMLRLRLANLKVLGCFSIGGMCCIE